ncbi:hypothetical protein Trydic_g9843 [Trypoxylus dichotomus]
MQALLRLRRWNTRYDDNSTIGNTSDDAVTEFDSDADSRKHPGTKLVPTGGTGSQFVSAIAPNLSTKEGRAPPVVLRQQLVQVATALQLQFHSNQLTEDKPLQIVLRGVPEDITEDEFKQDLARQEIHVLLYKLMVVVFA